MKIWFSMFLENLLHNVFLAPVAPQYRDFFRSNSVSSTGKNPGTYIIPLNATPWWRFFFFLIWHLGILIDRILVAFFFLQFGIQGRWHLGVLCRYRFFLIIRELPRLQSVTLNEVYTLHSNLEGKIHFLKKARWIGILYKSPLENAQNIWKGGICKESSWYL